MKHLIYISALILLVSCGNGGVKHQHQTDSLSHKSKHKSHHGSANEHMNEAPVEELIERFESKERDDYQQPEKLVAYLGNIQGKKIMDIGAGSGYFSVKLADKGANVIAADVNEDFQSYLKKRIEDKGLKNIELRKIPYDNPSLKDNEVDMVLIVNTYHHVENRVDYFSKVKKGIRNNGELVIVDFFKSEIPVGPPVDHKVSIDEIIAELKKAGYAEFNVNVELLPYQFIIKAK